MKPASIRTAPGTPIKGASGPCAGAFAAPASSREYKWVIFEEYQHTGLTTVWNVVNKVTGDEIGQVKWFGRFRAYCFFPEPNCAFARSCLLDIAAFIEAAMKSRRTGATIPWDVADPFKQYGCRCKCHAGGNEDCSPCCQGKRFRLIVR